MSENSETLAEDKTAASLSVSSSSPSGLDHLPNDWSIQANTPALISNKCIDLSITTEMMNTSQSDHLPSNSEKMLADTNQILTSSDQTSSKKLQTLLVATSNNQSQTHANGNPSSSFSIKTATCLDRISTENIAKLAAANDNSLNTTSSILQTATTTKMNDSISSASSDSPTNKVRFQGGQSNLGQTHLGKLHLGQSQSGGSLKKALRRQRHLKDQDPVLEMEQQDRQDRESLITTLHDRDSVSTTPSPTESGHSLDSYPHHQDSLNIHHRDSLNIYRVRQAEEARKNQMTKHVANRVRDFPRR